MKYGNDVYAKRRNFPLLQGADWKQKSKNLVNLPSRYFLTELFGKTPNFWNVTEFLKRQLKSYGTDDIITKNYKEDAPREEKTFRTGAGACVVCDAACTPGSQGTGRHQQLRTVCEYLL